MKKIKKVPSLVEEDSWNPTPLPPLVFEMYASLGFKADGFATTA